MSMTPANISSENLASLIVDELVDVGLIAKERFGEAEAIATEAISVRKWMADYWCFRCPNQEQTWVNDEVDYISELRGQILYANLRPLLEILAQLVDDEESGRQWWTTISEKIEDVAKRGNPSKWLDLGVYNGKKIRFWLRAEQEKSIVD